MIIQGCTVDDVKHIGGMSKNRQCLTTIVVCANAKTAILIDVQVSNPSSRTSDVVCINLWCVMDDNGVCTTVPDTCLSLSSDSSLRNRSQKLVSWKKFAGHAWNSVAAQ